MDAMDTSTIFQIDEKGLPIFEKERVYCLNQRYFTVGQFLGKGVSGRVVAALTADGSQNLAIKIYRKEILAKAQEELSFIQKMASTNEGELFVNCLDFFSMQGFPCLVFPRLYMDLHRYMTTELLLTQHLRMDQIRAIGHQVCRAIKSMHGINLLHGDIKTPNILLVEDPRTVRTPSIRLIDFGLTGTIQSGKAEFGVAQTWPYRPPEVHLTSHFDLKCDVWAVGCVLFELYTKRRMLLHKNFELESMEILFGEDFSLQIRQAIQTFKPEKSLDYEKFGSRRAHYKRIELFRRAPTSDEEQLFSLIKKMFVFSPPDRITIEEALNDSFFQQDAVS